MIEYRDYETSRESSAVIDGRVVALDEGPAADLALNAHLLSLGDPKLARGQLAAAEQAAALR